MTSSPMKNLVLFAFALLLLSGCKQEASPKGEYLLTNVDEHMKWIEDRLQDLHNGFALRYEHMATNSENEFVKMSVLRSKTDALVVQIANQAPVEVPALVRAYIEQLKEELMEEVAAGEIPLAIAEELLLTITVDDTALSKKIAQSKVRSAELYLSAFLFNQIGASEPIEEVQAADTSAY